MNAGKSNPVVIVNFMKNMDRCFMSVLSTFSLLLEHFIISFSVQFVPFNFPLDVFPPKQNNTVFTLCQLCILIRGLQYFITETFCADVFYPQCRCLQNPLAYGSSSLHQITLLGVPCCECLLRVQYTV